MTGRMDSWFRFKPIILVLECSSLAAAHQFVTCAMASGSRESGLSDADPYSLEEKPRPKSNVDITNFFIFNFTESSWRQKVFRLAPELGLAAGMRDHLVIETCPSGMAGGVSKTCTAPLARLTILFQVEGMHSDGIKLSQPRIFNEGSRIVREEGFRAFWKGNGVTIVHRLPYSSISFCSYDNYKRCLSNALGNEGKKTTFGVDIATRFMAGGGAGITAASMTYPLDLVRTRLAAQTKEMYYKGITHALVRIQQEEGVRGLYKGLGPTLMAVGPNIAISFSIYETLKSFWLQRSPELSPVVMSLGCGSITGICSSTVTFPIDLVRRRMQLEGAGGKARVYKTGLFDIVSHIIRTEGWSGMYRGIIPEYSKVIPSMGISFMTYELMNKILCSNTSDDA